ncbi:class I SAM-dependent methyltransferase [Brevibacillus laterosporus]|uniref:Class I SAM-dependent methyltransferase n=1 Tax=Brevibacillus halotolerans TaxID=1507437 RepID=A0ABT4HWP2_9BACL|nr:MULTISPECIES: class I SAM-dependent methyltransferase [Brevibacillus]MCR8985489.1 class I SAM-dependent methyltransferase [Brevibacillus laterosporus]MCZ0831222.1 class I SAM-dependent methyltransferase [Brevibacillus halotolerans]
MNNVWNKIIYKLGAPFYDVFFNSGIFLNARKKVFEDLVLPKKQQVLFVGIGTGADLCFFTEQDIQITAIDISPSMLSQAKEKTNKKMNIQFLEMDAQHLAFSDQSFDMVVANLILSVVPDANQCMKEIIRVTKERGTIIIFDKFEPKNKKLSLKKRLLRPVISLLGTDIGRNFEVIVKPYKGQIIVQGDIPILFRDMYRKITLQKIKRVSS